MQLKEQREQFTINFAQMHRDSQRNALVVAESILRETEARALSQNKELGSLSDIIPRYVEFSHMKVMLESEDPHRVIEAGMKWFKQEGPALTLMRGIKAAGLMYQESTGNTIFKLAKDPDEFVYINGPVLWNLPFFQNYQAPSDLLAGFMITLLPCRTSAQLAYMIALAKTTKEVVFRRDKLEEDIKSIKEKKYPLPAIMREF